jgi:hypothetical protein
MAKKTTLFVSVLMRDGSLTRLDLMQCGRWSPCPGSGIHKRYFRSDAGGLWFAQVHRTTRDTLDSLFFKANLDTGIRNGQELPDIDVYVEAWEPAVARMFYLASEEKPVVISNLSRRIATLDGSTFIDLHRAWMSDGSPLAPEIPTVASMWPATSNKQSRDS